MNLGLLIVPAIAGYWLLDRTCLWQYQLRRESGYSLFFKVCHSRSRPRCGGADLLRRS